LLAARFGTGELRGELGDALLKPPAQLLSENTGLVTKPFRRASRPAT
jgi:hypothetical protein